MTPRRLVIEAAWPLAMATLVLLLADPAHSLSDLRFDLVAALGPLAEQQGLPAAVLPWLLYPLVAANILFPVWLWSWLANGARLRSQLDQADQRPAPWPRVSRSQAAPGLEARHIAFPGRGWSVAALTTGLFLLLVVFALALWGRDQWRMAVAGPEGGWPAKLAVSAELVLLWLAARPCWAVGLRHALAPLRRLRSAAHGWGGWFVQAQGDDGLMARRVIDDSAVSPDFAANLARRIRDVV